MIVVWLVLAAAGLGAALVAADRSVGHASSLAFGWNLPPFLIGITLVGIGTDLPEIANSIIASATDNADLNVGDSVGSAVTQSTLVLGLLPFVGGAMRAGRARVLLAGIFTTIALGLVSVAVLNDHLSRLDGLILVGFWFVSQVVLWRNAPPASEPVLRMPTRRRSYHLLATMGWLAVVGAGATLAVFSVVELAETLAVPALLLSFFAQSIGTSLPEATVAMTAVRRGEKDLALGNILGASLADSSISVGIGPLLFPAMLEEGALALRASLGALVVLGLVTALLSWRREHTRPTGVVLLALYAVFYPLLLA